MTGRSPPTLEKVCTPCRFVACAKADPLDWIHSFWGWTVWCHRLARRYASGLEVRPLPARPGHAQQDVWVGFHIR